MQAWRARRPFFTRNCGYCGQTWRTQNAKARFCSYSCGVLGTDAKRRKRRSRGRYLLKAHRGGVELLHRLVWIAAHGPIPKGYVIHHRNENARDNRLENLELLSRAEHNRLHFGGVTYPPTMRVRWTEARRRWWRNRPRRLCSVDGCERPHAAKGFCNAHYLVHRRKSMGHYLHKIHNGRRELAHRVVWMLAHGPIPKGSVIHHRNGDVREKPRAAYRCRTQPRAWLLHASHTLRARGRWKPGPTNAPSPGWSKRKGSRGSVARRSSASPLRWPTA
jgi:hypothetical protein